MTIFCQLFIAGSFPPELYIERICYKKKKNNLKFTYEVQVMNLLIHLQFFLLLHKLEFQQLLILYQILVEILHSKFNFVTKKHFLQLNKYIQ